MPTSCGPGPPLDDDAAVDLSLTPHDRCARIRRRTLTETQSQSQTRTQTQVQATGIPRWLLMLLLLFVIVAQTPQRQVAAEKSKHCKYFQLSIYLSIYSISRNISVCIYVGLKSKFCSTFTLVRCPLENNSSLFALRQQIISLQDK